MTMQKNDRMGFFPPFPDGFPTGFEVIFIRNEPTFAVLQVDHKYLKDGIDTYAYIGMIIVDKTDGEYSHEPFLCILPEVSWTERAEDYHKALLLLGDRYYRK